MDIEISICTFQNGDFDVMFRNPETGREIALSGHQNIKGNDFEFINEIAPACVWTKYQRITPEP